jgi:LysM repeat protein
VGIYTGGDKYIHSPSSGKRVQESSLDDRGRGDRFVGGRRVIDNQGVSLISEILKKEWIAKSRHQIDTEVKTAADSKRRPPASGGAKPKSETASNKKKPTVHKVASGDNLVTLARRYGVTVNDIVAANDLADRHKLKIGQTLKIPSKKGSSQTAKNKTGNKRAGQTARTPDSKI